MMSAAELRELWDLLARAERGALGAADERRIRAVVGREMPYANADDLGTVLHHARWIYLVQRFVPPGETLRPPASA